MTGQTESGYGWVCFPLGYCEIGALCCGPTALAEESCSEQGVSELPLVSCDPVPCPQEHRQTTP